MEEKNNIELEKALREALKGLDRDNGLGAVLRMLADYVDCLENVQLLPILTRLKYYNGAFVMFDYLRRNRQLGRKEGLFDANVMKNLYKVFRRLTHEERED